MEVRDHVLKVSEVRDHVPKVSDSAVLEWTGSHWLNTTQNGQVTAESFSILQEEIQCCYRLLDKTSPMNHH